MWSFVKRLLGILIRYLHRITGKEKTSKIMTKEDIRNLITQLNEYIKSFNETTVIIARSKKDAQNAKETADSYRKKAMAILQKIDPEYSEDLAAKTMAQREQQLQLYKKHLENQKKHDAISVEIGSKIKNLKMEISDWETKSYPLHSSKKYTPIRPKIKKVSANIDSSEAIEMLKKLSEEVSNNKKTALDSKSIDEEISSIIIDNEGINALHTLKEEMGLIKKEVKKDNDEECL